MSECCDHRHLVRALVNQSADPAMPRLQRRLDLVQCLPGPRLQQAMRLLPKGFLGAKAVAFLHRLRPVSDVAVPRANQRRRNVRRRIGNQWTHPAHLPLALPNLTHADCYSAR